MKYFVLERRRSTGDVHVDEFASSDDALRELRVREANHGHEFEVVLFLATDLEALKSTHGRYFGSEELGADALRTAARRDAFSTV